MSNDRGQTILVVWRNSFVHIRDDKNHDYKEYERTDSNFDKVKQFSLNDGYHVTIIGYRAAPFFAGPEEDEYFPYFEGSIDPAASYLIITIDSMAGLKGMSWKYVLP